MKGLIEPLKNSNVFHNLIEYIDNKSNVVVNNALEGQKSHLIGAIESVRDNVTFVITSSELSAKEMVEDLRYFSNRDVYLYPNKDILFYGADIQSIDITKKRFTIINKLLNNEKITIVAPIDTLFDRLIPIDVLKKYQINIEVGNVIAIEDLIKQLVGMGYEKRNKVEAIGQFSVRGGIVDIFTTISDNAFRIEFWDDEVDSIRVLDSRGERSIKKVEDITIFPVKELLFDDEVKNKALEKIKKEYDKTYKSLEKKGLKEEKENLYGFYNTVIEDVKYFSKHLEILFDYFYSEKYTLLDYIPKDSLVYIDEPTRVKGYGENIYNEFAESIKMKILHGNLFANSIDMIVDYNFVLKQLEKFSKIIFSTLYTSNEFKNIETLDFSCRYVALTKNRVDLLSDEIKELREENFAIVILAGNKSSGLKLKEALEDYSIIGHYTEEIKETDLKEGITYISHGSLQKSFAYKNLKLAIISDREFFGTEKKKKKKYTNKNSKKISSFDELKVGDYVVHENYGIGIFSGIEKIRVDNTVKDYVIVNYAENGVLNLPITQLDKLQKYVGSDAGKVKIHKMGGKEWNKTKNRTKKVVEILAKELIELYAKRQATVGFTYSEDNLWQKEFEDKFPFEETEDQINAIIDVKKDMEQSKVMDRLVCGDVGFGKTEVAIRAAFKAVQDGKQVAYLVPTTILAQQHYNTFRERMADYPIKVELLSRFRTAKEIKESLFNLSIGKSEIVIGTHRILSKDVKFKDLGLVIVDEEQRFGVTHKEKLKQMRTNVDVLTLTATPIPRTLHMSLTGIRDLSLLEEAPRERLPIQTYVMEYNEESIHDAIIREIGRGGQVFFLHNRVNTIEDVSYKIANLVPEATVTYAHGQMSIRELENIMKDFIEGDIDVLICTTIIETGLDITNANTIIINDADKMGLSQLYQLRGRVGRSNKKAYAYLLYKKDKVLREVAEKRLETLKEFTAFGSGYKISMRDLEIRGSGSLLGEQQSGHIDSVGYDMYCKLLDRAVKELQGEIIAPEFDTKIDININSFISSNYIEDEIQRIDIYKKIAFIQNEEMYYDLQEEIEDRYGDLPKPVQNLLDVALVKANLRSVDATSIVERNNSLVITFRKDACIDGEKLLEFVKSNRDITFKSAQYPEMTYRFRNKINIKDILKLSEEIADLKIQEVLI